MQPAAEPPPVAARLPGESEWGAFVDTYGRALLACLRQRALPRDQAGALARQLLHEMAREFAGIVGEPSVRFRAWLQYAAHTAWCRLMEGRSEGVGETQGDPTLALLLSMEAHDALLKVLDNECSHQRRREVLPRAQSQADGGEWEVFYALVLENQLPMDVAAQM